jgi:hypothetical protein
MYQKVCLAKAINDLGEKFGGEGEIQGVSAKLYLKAYKFNFFHFFIRKNI